MCNTKKNPDSEILVSHSPIKQIFINDNDNKIETDKKGGKAKNIFFLWYAVHILSFNPKWHGLIFTETGMGGWIPPPLISRG